jgi:peptidoglycan L-alanyl-D-glutamate endopeptidase CwlK
MLRMYSLSTNSMSKLATCERDIQTVIQEAIKCSDVDFGVSHGHRTPEEQFNLFQIGRKEVNGKWIIADKSTVVTYCDGYEKKSKHNYSPSKAVDIYAYVKGKAVWDREHLLYLCGIITGVANRLHKSGRITHRLVNGGNWNKDGELITDHTFIDLPHYEIVK